MKSTDASGANLLSIRSHVLLARTEPVVPSSVNAQWTSAAAEHHSVSPLLSAERCCCRSYCQEWKAQILSSHSDIVLQAAVLLTVVEVSQAMDQQVNVDARAVKKDSVCLVLVQGNHLSTMHSHRDACRSEAEARVNMH